MSGGANRLAETVAKLCGGIAVCSSATDVNGIFAVDEWASLHGLSIDGRSAAKEVSATLLEGRQVSFRSDFPVIGTLPAGFTTSKRELGVYITAQNSFPFTKTLRLVPKILDVGIGCKRDTPAYAIAAALGHAFDANHLSTQAILALHTIDVKKEEPGLMSFCKKHGWPLHTYTADELSALDGEFTKSDFVQHTVGVDNVCERSACMAGGTLIQKKYSEDGVTVAIAQQSYVVSFEGDKE